METDPFTLALHPYPFLEGGRDGVLGRTDAFRAYYDCRIGRTPLWSI